jgi:hypothetical protein
MTAYAEQFASAPRATFGFAHLNWFRAKLAAAGQQISQFATANDARYWNPDTESFCSSRDGLPDSPMLLHPTVVAIHLLTKR